MFDRELAISAVEGQRAPVFTAKEDAYHITLTLLFSRFFSSCFLPYTADGPERRGLLAQQMRCCTVAVAKKR